MTQNTHVRLIESNAFYVTHVFQANDKTEKTQIIWTMESEYTLIHTGEKIRSSIHRDAGWAGPSARTISYYEQFATSARKKMYRDAGHMVDKYQNNEACCSHRWFLSCVWMRHDAWSCDDESMHTLIDAVTDTQSRALSLSHTLGPALTLGMCENICATCLVHVCAMPDERVWHDFMLNPLYPD